MLERLTRIHEEIDALLVDHELLTRPPAPDVAAIVAMQLKLAKANRERKALIDRIYARIEGRSDLARDHVQQLREDDRQIRAQASQLIGDWPRQRVEGEWPAYQKNAVAVRRWNRQRIALEQKLLFPLLTDVPAD